MSKDKLFDQPLFLGILEFEWLCNALSTYDVASKNLEAYTAGYHEQYADLVMLLQSKAALEWTSPSQIHTVNEKQKRPHVASVVKFAQRFENLGLTKGQFKVLCAGAVFDCLMDTLRDRTYEVIREPPVIPIDYPSKRVSGFQLQITNELQELHTIELPSVQNKYPLHHMRTDPCDLGSHTIRNIDALGMLQYEGESTPNLLTWSFADLLYWQEKVLAFFGRHRLLSFSYWDYIRDHPYGVHPIWLTSSKVVFGNSYVDIDNVYFVPVVEFKKNTNFTKEVRYNLVPLAFIPYLFYEHGDYVLPYLTKRDT